MNDQPNDPLQAIRDTTPTADQAAAHMSAVLKPLGSPVPESLNLGYLRHFAITLGDPFPEDWQP